MRTLLSRRSSAAGIARPAARSFRLPRPGGAGVCAMLVAIAAMVIGPDAVAASAQACYSREIVSHALSAIVNISVVKVVRGNGENEETDTGKGNVASAATDDPAHPAA